MSQVSKLYTYWSNNIPLSTALPVSQVFLDIVPPQSSYPYATLSVIAQTADYPVAAFHIEHTRFQISLWHTDLAALETLTDTVSGQFSQAYLTPATLICTRMNRIYRAAVQNSIYTYNLILEFDWAENEVAP